MYTYIHYYLFVCGQDDNACSIIDLVHMVHFRRAPSASALHAHRFACPVFHDRFISEMSARWHQCMMFISKIIIWLACLKNPWWKFTVVSGEILTTINVNTTLDHIVCMHLIWIWLAYLTDLTTVLHDLALVLFQLGHDGHFLSGHTIDLVICWAELFGQFSNLL